MDDIPVTDADTFLRGRIREASKEFKSKQIQALDALPMFRNLADIGVLPETLRSLTSEALTAIDNEEDEDSLLVTPIKNQTKDKKASRD